MAVLTPKSELLLYDANQSSWIFLSKCIVLSKSEKEIKKIFFCEFHISDLINL